MTDCGRPTSRTCPFLAQLKTTSFAFRPHFVFCAHQEIPFTMRRSKSDPAKYARNYRSISQRRMTQYDGLDEEKEMDRLRAVLRNSQHQLKLHQGDDNDDDDNEDEDQQKANSNNNNNRKKRKRASNDAKLVEQQHEENGSGSILSSELTNELGTYNNGTYNSSAENPLVIIPSKSKKKKQKEEKKKLPAQLTPQEIKQAKLLQKNTTRKLQQLETRAAQKKKRSELYKQLEHHAQQVPLPQGDLMALLSSSGNLSRKDNSTKKQTLKKLLQKERAGMNLSVAETKLLYTERIVDEDDADLRDALASTEKSKRAMEQDTAQSPEEFVRDEGGGTMTKNRKRKVGDRATKSTKHGATEVSKRNTPGPTAVVKQLQEQDQQEPTTSDVLSTMRDWDNSERATLPNATVPKGESETTPNHEDPAKPATSSFSFVAQMMASLSQLKHDTDQRRQEEVKEETTEEDTSSSLEHEQKYVPSNPTVLKTAARLRLQSTMIDMKRKVVPISRPEAIEKARYDLPVSAMEFEIVDAIRNNDVTIVCAETGSGKSTQVCQCKRLVVSTNPRSRIGKFVPSLTWAVPFFGESHKVLIIRLSLPFFTVATVMFVISLVRRSSLRSRIFKMSVQS
jgi:hypothetical protein